MEFLVNRHDHERIYGDCICRWFVQTRDEHLGQSKITVHNQSITICYNWTLKPNVITGYKTGYIHNHFYNRFLLLKTGFWFNNWFFFPKNK